MRVRELHRRGRPALACALAVALACAAFTGGASAQQPASNAPPPSPRAAAPIDLTGYWVSVVSEDWRHRMATPRKGDYESLPLNAEGRRVADAWDLDGGQRGRAAVQGIRRRRHHASAGTAAHHLAGRQHAEDRVRCRHANAAARTSTRRATGRRERPGRGIRRAEWEGPPGGGGAPGARADRQQHGTDRAGRRRPRAARRSAAHGRDQPGRLVEGRSRRISAKDTCERTACRTARTRRSRSTSIACRSSRTATSGCTSSRSSRIRSI